jgi:hypothetical protein
MTIRLSVLRAGRNLPPGRFLVLISVRDLVDSRAILRLDGLGKLKKSNYLIGNRTRDFPACSIVPKPTTLPPHVHLLKKLNDTVTNWTPRPNSCSTYVESGNKFHLLQVTFTTSSWLNIPRGVSISPPSNLTAKFKICTVISLQKDKL